MKLEEIIEYVPLDKDKYPAGLQLSSEIWHETKSGRGQGIEVNGIKAFWDGVKMEGRSGQQRFSIEINYATAEVIQLTLLMSFPWYQSGLRSQDQFNRTRERLTRIIDGLRKRREIIHDKSFERAPTSGAAQL